ncbi:MAG: hypothetical protein RLZZ227_1301 [Pseudomonadota bacterium]|jgi:hypothetical protein
MKRSRRFLLGTFLALLVAPVLLVAYARISGEGSLRELPAPERMTPEELAALRDFDQIEVRGDFVLEVVSAADYAVEYATLPQQRSFFRARVDDRTLTIESFGNRMETGVGVVRVALPELSRIDAQSLAGLTVRNFANDSLDIRAIAAGSLVIADNRIGTLRMETQVRSIEFSGNTIGNSDIHTFGTRITME